MINWYGLKRKIIAYVKDERSNLNTTIIALKFTMSSCEIMGLHESLFDHTFSKTCQYVIVDENVCKNFKFVSIKSTQSNLQKMYKLM
jgi:hypothetical protein